jgi:hypothetical protein
MLFHIIFFENLEFSENNIINVKATKVVQVH